MTITPKPLETTLTFAEQLELRKFMKLVDMPVLIAKFEYLRKHIVEELEAKGYVRKLSECAAYYRYQLVIRTNNK